MALILAAATLGMLSASAPASADDSIGSVTTISGNAQIQRGGAVLPAQQGTPVKLHDQVTTQPGSSLTLGFADGSSMALSGASGVAIEESATVGGQTVPSRVTLLSGSIHTIVPDKTTGQSHTIEVDNPSFKVTGPAPSP
jgi:hypothetical protein